MKELLEPYLKMALESGAKTAEQAANFVMTQSPELVKEVILWGWVSQLLAPIFGLILIILGIYLHLKYHKQKLKEDGSIDRGNSGYWTGDASYPPGILGVLLMFGFGCLIFFCNIADVLYPLVAPRLYLIETLAKLIK